MNWDAIGATGEIIGAIAVVATLIYLSVQTNLSRKASESTAKFSELQHSGTLVNLYSRWRSMLVSNSALLGILEKSNRNEELSKEEESQLMYLFHDLFFTAGFSHQSAVAAGTIHANSADVQYLLDTFQRYPAAETEWHKVKHMVKDLGPDLVATIDQELKSR